MCLLIHALKRDCWLTNPFHLRFSPRKHTQNKQLKISREINQSCHSLCSMKSVFRNICIAGLWALGDLSTVQTDLLGGGGGSLRQILGTLMPIAISRWLTTALLSLSGRSCSFPKICHSLTIESSRENKYYLREWCFITQHSREMKTPLQTNVNIKRKLWLQVLSLVFNHFAYKPFGKMKPIFTWLAKEIRLCGKLDLIYLTVFQTSWLNCHFGYDCNCF